jgi:hypothetical protein
LDKKLKRKIIILGLTALLSMAVVGCSATKNENLKKSIDGASSQLNKIDNEEIKGLTYEQAQDLMKKINSELSEFKPQLTPDNQTIILNLATREVSDKIEQEYIMINTVADKKNYTIQIEGNIFKDEDGNVAKNDASVYALYDLLTATKNINNISLSKCMDVLNNSEIDNENLNKALKSFDNVDFDFTKKEIHFKLEKVYKRIESVSKNRKITYEDYKKERTTLKESLKKYTEDFAKANNLKTVISEKTSEKNNINSFGVKNDNNLEQSITLSTDISSLNSKTITNMYEFKVPSNNGDPKSLQLSKDFLVGAIRIINSTTNSDINYGKIEDVIKSNNIRTKYLDKNSNFETVFEYSGSLERSLNNNNYRLTEKLEI